MPLRGQEAPPKAAKTSEAVAAIDVEGLAARARKSIAVVSYSDRDGLKDFLKINQIGTEVYYPVPMHLQKCFAGLGYRKGDFPHSEEAALTTLAIPVYPELTEAQKQHVVNTLGAFAAAKTTRRAAAG